MGIPSFYRQLVRRFPHLITKGVGPPPDWLCLDFNCAMYHALRKMPPYQEENKLAWEGILCTSIATYMTELITMTKPKKGVYVSCDGAVCAAKRRQQRLRRFKGPWIAALEAGVKGQHNVLGWDQNALTPGSTFMGRLGSTLTDAGHHAQKTAGVPITVSTTAEAGEGEHKLLAHMRHINRNLATPLSCTIYGLDADLILLSMLLSSETGASVRLMREAQEFEATRDSNEWRNLDINALAHVMIPTTTKSNTNDFVATMSLLGNDFLPRSLTHTVRDDGIPNLITTLEKHVWGRNLRIVNPDGSLSREGVLAVVRSWALTEEEDITLAAQTALRVSRRHPGVGASPEETAMRRWNAQPAQWASSAKLLGPDNRLVKGWRKMYGTWAGKSVNNYVAGIAWVWEYYSGRAIDHGWCFEEHLPPLWSDVAAQLSNADGDRIAAPPIQYPDPLPDWLHLLSVLPADSVARLLPPHVQRFMARAPWYWPTSWSLFDIGKTQMWECEPIIPVIPESVLRQWLQAH